MTISDVLQQKPVSDLDLTRYVAVSPTDSVGETVRSMCAAGHACACVVDDRTLVGIFTQRDVLQRVIGRPRIWDRPITEEMSETVKTMRHDQSVGDGLEVMIDWWVRNVPVLDDDDELAGNLSFYEIMRTMADLMESRAGIERRGPTVQHGLAFVDFTGLKTTPPVMVHVDDSAEIAAHHMKVRAIGSVLVVDEREHLVGVVTEFDLQTKVGCERADLSTLPVSEVMTPAPVAISARAPIADAIRKMADRGFSHIPLLGESGRPVAVASFRDVAAYFEASVESLI